LCSWFSPKRQIFPGPKWRSSQCSRYDIGWHLGYVPCQGEIQRKSNDFVLME
jgi:hypothetical protein